MSLKTNKKNEFEVLSRVTMKSTLILDLIPCSPIEDEMGRACSTNGGEDRILV
jgi:hypothetical protein